MATSAIGPGFLTQTTFFTDRLRADFAFAILASILVDVAVQANVWRVLGVSRRRAQELASDLVPGLGPVVAVLVAFGGFVFNVGNIAGCGLGLAVFGFRGSLWAGLSGAFAFLLLVLPGAGRAMDRFVQTLGGLMIVLTGVVMVSSHPDYLGAARAAVAPGRLAFLPIVTLVGGTVGGYITFSGVHRLLDAGVGGESDLGSLSRASVLGVVVTGAMRILLFLAVLGVVARAATGLDPANPPASAFRLGAGPLGYHFFGVVLWSASITSVVGCSYTSLSFVRTLWAPLERHEHLALGVFIGASLATLALFGQPVRLLILAGALNGLILPVTLGIVLVAARRPSLMGRYRHPGWLLGLGWTAWAMAVVAGALSLRALATL